MNIHSFVARATASKTPAAAERPDDKREAVLRAALELFAERGFHGTAVPEIAERAKVAAGTIYRYFDGKEALVNALFKRYKTALAATLMGDFPFDGTPRQQFHHFFVRAMLFAKKEKLALQFLEAHHHAPYLDAESRAIEERTLEPARLFFEQADRLKITRRVKPEALGAMVWGAIVGLLKAGWEGRLEVDAKVEQGVEDALWDALRKPSD